MKVKLAFAAVAALLSVFAASCGGVKNEPNLAKAVERTEATGSARIEMAVHATEAGADIDWRCVGAADYERDRFRMACSGHELGDLEWREIGSTTYQRTGDPNEAKPWTKFSNDDDDRSGHEFSPDRILELLRSASRRTERIGEERVRDEETVHYALTVDCEVAELGNCMYETEVVDVWIDDHGLVRRIRMDEDDAEFEVEFFDFGAEVAIEPPPVDQVKDFEPPKPQSCTDGVAEPISVERAIGVLSDHGFEMKRDDSWCWAGVAASLSSGFDEPDDLSCVVLAKPGGEDSGVIVKTQTIPGGGADAPEPVGRELENLHCTLFLERESDEAVDRLDAALAELKRGIGP